MILATIGVMMIAAGVIVILATKRITYEILGLVCGEMGVVLLMLCAPSNF